MLRFKHGKALLILTALTTIASAVLCISCSKLKLHSTQHEKDSIFSVKIDSALFKKWSFKYPVTYIFDLPEDASNVKIFTSDKYSGHWRQLQEKTSNDFYNGIECARFDYLHNKAYVSTGFISTNNIYIKFENIPYAAYNSIAKYYDNRKAAYTLSNDNWGINNASGGIWHGMTDDSSDKYQASVHAARMYNLPISIAINSKCGVDGPVGGRQTWVNMQTELNNCTESFCWEPVVHTRTHPCSDDAYNVHGYEWEILGCRDDILNNLTNIPYGQYVFEFILPCAYKNNNIRNVSDKEFLFLRDWDMGDHPHSINYTSWNEEYQFFGIGGIQTKSYDAILQSEKPPGRYDKNHVNELNNDFDTVYDNGGIFYAMWHSDRYSNSVIHSTDPPESGTASTLMQHFAHVANRKDVWYTANGWLYSYRIVAERAETIKISQ